MSDQFFWIRLIRVVDAIPPNFNTQQLDSARDRNLFKLNLFNTSKFVTLGYPI